MSLFYKVLLSVYHTSCVCKFMFPQFWKIWGLRFRSLLPPCSCLMEGSHNMARQVLTFAKTVCEVTALLWVIQDSHSKAAEHQHGASDQLNGVSLQIRKKKK